MVWWLKLPLVVARRVLISPFRGAGGEFNIILTISYLADRNSIGVMLGVYVGGVSGAHLNPAVTFANWYV